MNLHFKQGGWLSGLPKVIEYYLANREFNFWDFLQTIDSSLNRNVSLWSLPIQKKSAVFEDVLEILKRFDVTVLVDSYQI